MAEVFVSAVIGAPAARVWAVVRDFNALPDWHPAIAASRIEEGRPPDQVGCVRAFSLTDGGQIRERLLALSDYDFSVTYAILESPMPLENYVATLRFTPITETDETFAEWTAEFDCAPGDEAALVRDIGEGVFAGGLAALDARLKGGG